MAIVMLDSEQGGIQSARIGSGSGKVQIWVVDSDKHAPQKDTKRRNLMIEHKYFDFFRLRQKI